MKKIKPKDIKPVFQKYDKFQGKLEEYNINSIFKYGIYGKAAPMYGNGKILPGGATQILFPLSIAYMQLLGMLYLA